MKSICTSCPPSKTVFQKIGAALFAFVIGCNSSSIHAATVNWIAPSQDNYTNPAAWSSSNLPQPADTATVGNAVVANGSVLFTNASGNPLPTNALTSLLLGNASGSTGLFTMGSGSLSITNSGATALIPGSAANSSGTFIMTGGTLNVTRSTANFFQDAFQLANAAGSSGTFTLNGGIATFLCGIEIGTAGIGTINVNGGTLIDNGWFGVARGNATNSVAQGFFNLTSGTVYILRNPGTDTGANGVSFTQNGTNGAVSISGGSLYCNCIRFATGPGASRTDWETLNISGGDIYLGSQGVLSAGVAGTHNISINLSGGTFHTVDLGPNTGGTQGLASVATDGTNWGWGPTLAANLTNAPGSGTVTFAPDTNRTIALSNSFSGPGNLAMTGPGTLVLNGVSTYTGTTTVTGGTIAGTGSVQSSAVTANSASTIAPGGTLTVGTLTLGNNLTLNSSTNIIKLSGNPATVGSGVNDLLNVNGNVSLQGVTTVKIVPLAPLSTASPYTILQYSGTPLTAGDAAHLHVISDNPRYNFSVVDPSTTPGTIQINVTGNAANLVWRGGVSGNPTAWDNITTNWLNTGTSARDFFFNGDATTFDDTATTNLVIIVGTEQPSSITMANNSTPFTFTGAGSLSGALSLTGTGSLTLSMSTAPNFSTITANSGTLAFNIQGPVSYPISTPISDNGGGQGNIVKTGTNTLVLQGNNSQYTGAISVTNGVLQYTNALGLGTAAAPLYVTNTGTVDLNGVVPGLKNFIIAGDGFNGKGALINSSGTQLQNGNGVNNLSLAADASVGAANRWDVYQNSMHGNGFKLTSVGPGTVLFVDVGDTSLGDIHVVAGRIGFQGNASMGDPSKTAVVESNAILSMFAIANALSTNGGGEKRLVLNGNAVLDSGGASNNFNTAVFLSGTNLIGTRSTLHLWGNISDTNGPGGFILGTDSVGASGGDLWLDGINTYSGATIISNRTVYVGANSSLGSSTPIFINSGAKLDVSALPTFSIGTGRTLAGNGTITANSVVLGAGATLAPGVPGTNTSSLTLSGSLTLQAGSTNVVVVNKTGSVANNKVIGLTSVSMGGTLVVNSVGNPLAGGDAIPILSSLGTYSGGFTNIIPATPGAGLVWNTSTMTSDGTLRVQSTGPATTPTNIVFSFASGQLTMSWPTNYTGWTLQSQTNNFGVGLSTNWVDIPGSSVTNQVIIPVDNTKGSAFYRMILRF